MSLTARSINTVSEACIKKNKNIKNTLLFIFLCVTRIQQSIIYFSLIANKLFLTQCMDWFVSVPTTLQRKCICQAHMPRKEEGWEYEHGWQACMHGSSPLLLRFRVKAGRLPRRTEGLGGSLFITFRDQCVFLWQRAESWDTWDPPRSLHSAIILPAVLTAVVMEAEHTPPTTRGGQQ